MRNSIEPRDCAYSVPRTTKKGDVVWDCTCSILAAVARKWGVALAREVELRTPASATKRPCTSELVCKCPCFTHVPNLGDEADLFEMVEECE